MTENKMLYPLKFIPIFKNKMWGGGKIREQLNKTDAPMQFCGECWEISGVKDNVSQISNGFLAENDLNELVEVYMGDLVGEKIYDRFLQHFPLLIKFIDATQNLSLQVHPDDTMAKKIPNAEGKTELWYIIDAEPHAGLYIGFKKNVDKEKYLQKLSQNRVEELLEFYQVKAGDIFFVPGGTVHAIGKGVLLAEIQQSSDTTYRIFDWNRKDEDGNSRELHLALAEQAINFESEHFPKILYDNNLEGTSPLLRTPFFNLNFLYYKQIIEKIYVAIDSFIIYVCVEGGANISIDGEADCYFKKGDTVLIPASCQELVILPTPVVKLLEIYME